MVESKSGLSAEEKARLNRKAAELVGYTVIDVPFVPRDVVIRGDKPCFTPAAYQCFRQTYPAANIKSVPQFTEDWALAGMLLEMLPPNIAVKRTTDGISIRGWYVSGRTAYVDHCMGFDANDPKVAIVQAFIEWKTQQAKEPVIAASDKEKP